MMEEEGRPPLGEVCLKHLLVAMKETSSSQDLIQNPQAPEVMSAVTPRDQSLQPDQQLQMLKAVTQAANSSLILEDIFESLGDVLHQYIPYDEAVILVLETSQNGINILVRMTADGTLKITGENNAFAGYDTVVHNVLNRRTAQYYDEAALKSSVVFSEDAKEAFVIPLINKGLTIGLIAVSSATPHTFGQEHQDLLKEVSQQIAVAVENAKLYWQTQIQASREFLINQLTKAIRQSLDIKDILTTAVQELGKVMGVSRCYIHYFPDADRLTLNPENTDPSLPALNPTSVPEMFQYIMPGVQGIPEDSIREMNLGQRIYQLRISQATDDQQDDVVTNPFILNDVRDCPPAIAAHGVLETFFEQHDIRSLAIFPILIAHQIVGTITLHQCDTYRVWVAEDIALLKAIAEHLGVALYQAMLFMERDEQKKSLEDALTELQQAQIHLIQNEKMAMLGQFVAGIAHEVNTPLGVMTSNNGTMQGCVEKLKQLGNEDTEVAKWLSSLTQLLAMNQMAGERIQETVRNLQNFVRLDESEIKSVRLEDSLDSTLLLLKSALNDARIQVTKNFPPDFPLVGCFPGLLNQVFMNLLVNAIHAYDGLASPEPKRIEIRGQYDPDTHLVRITFQDWGKGIKPAHLARIFDPGFTTKGVGVGTGLGLALCFKIMEKHHGRIEVESQDHSLSGHGTLMTVMLPVKPGM